MNNKIKGLGLVAISAFIPVFATFAEDAITETIKNINIWLTTVGGGLAVLSIIIAGVLMVLSNENEKNVANAKNIIKWAMIGLGIILMANVLTTIVRGLVVQQ
ncbi:MAG TPA: pilin [Candidatus Pacearchaeota archaeon]|nr:pilin [Candidatus Pacearchaeota archaeon]